ncbi:dTDP-4-dehydrorhamnose reductase [Amycolatopsis xylanica]|uniref:dTDP-4-dehydrorhamnose reductase n=1 Tax=Amycolatopsis xylanica TaxID=589385 RepID=A0A1H2VQG6_9PSEU|nr:SDR family oxidoreductase [Amycolatopsis xylanica]SDW70184.1 dTDP-4-dehydrorhamnose reductase [Amycolatopsis xylanica]
MTSLPRQAPTVLVTGAAGMLARALVPVLLDAGFRVTVTDIDLSVPAPWGPGGPILSTVDVRVDSQVELAVRAAAPDVVLHLAAETSLEICENDPAHAMSTNAEAVRRVALSCRRNGARMVYISTAGVFDGEKDDPYTEADAPRPINWYGRSKAVGEEHVAGLLDGHHILRAGWMVGAPMAKDHKFLGRIVGQLKSGRTVLNAVGDKFGSPTYAPDFAATMLPILRGEVAPGLYHAVSEGRRSRYQIAREIVATLGRDDIEVREVDSAFFARDFFAPRPRSEVLSNTSLRAAGRNLMRPWPEPLADYLRPWQAELGTPLRSASR